MSIVTVFGASGFIGRYVVAEFARTGARVRAAVRRPERAGFLRPLGDVGQVTPVQANIRDDASVAAAVQDADTVVNLVGLLAERGRQSFAAVHVEGAQRVAAASRDAGAATLVHVSAIGADPAAAAVYAATKGRAETLVREAFPAASVVRPSIVFGPEDDFFNKFAVMARLAPALPLIGGGRTRFQPVYVADVARAIAAIAGDRVREGQTWELGGPQILEFRELMEMMLAEIDRRRLLVPLPFPLAACVGLVLEQLPFPPLTRDQVRLLRCDSVVTGEHPGLDDLGIDPTAVGAILQTYLRRYRRGVWHR